LHGGSWQHGRLDGQFHCDFFFARAGDVMALSGDSFNREPLKIVWIDSGLIKILNLIGMLTLAELEVGV